MKALYIFCLPLLCSNLCVASNDPNLPGVKLASTPKVDGKIGPGEWPEEARRQDFVDKDTRLASNEPAEFWLAADEKFIYFAARVTADPRKVVAEQFRPNAGVGGDDYFTLILDPTGSTSNYNSFRISAGGGTSVDLAGGRAAKTEWLGEFEARSRLTETGWETEARIPWSLMVIPQGGERQLHYNIRWFRSNKQNTYEFAYVNNDFEKFPLWGPVQVPPVPASREINLLPYAILGVEKNRNQIADFGLDAKVAVTNRLTLVTTVNPDFRNIENDILSLDFSYFERLAGEARPFFQEGSDFRQTGFGRTLFASQRLNKFEVGANLYGNLNDTTQIGLLNASDIGKFSANVLSISTRPAKGQNAIFSVVSYEEKGKRNLSGFANFGRREGSLNTYVSLGVTDDQERKKGSFGYLGFDNERPGFSYGGGYEFVTPDFFPRIGFSFDEDYKGFNGYLGFERTTNSGPIRDFQTWLSGRSFERFNGGFYRNEIELYTGINLANRLAINTNINRANFQGSPDHLYSLGLRYPYDRPSHNVGIGVDQGQFQGDDYQSVRLTWSTRPVKRSTLSLSSQFVDFRGASQQHILGFSYDLNAFESFGGRLVKRDNDWNWYVSYRLSGKRGNEVFVILGDPNATTFRTRALVKVVLPVTIRS
ncbi:MAG: DUF5916 domain-containing protein [Fimbriimonadaceae bacterium]|jgi:hypothetical protein|nr:DUF5916 domain-containing protein [Fimbriimonadaceae bacterium]